MVIGYLFNAIKYGPNCIDDPPPKIHKKSLRVILIIGFMVNIDNHPILYIAKDMPLYLSNLPKVVILNITPNIAIDHIAIITL